MKKKYDIRVCTKGENYGEPGETIKTIKRILTTEMFGNFNPAFCTYEGAKYLVSSEAGDLSDPFRREEHYTNTFYIELKKEDTQ